MPQQCIMPNRLGLETQDLGDKIPLDLLRVVRIIPWLVWKVNGAPGMIRTCDPLIRSLKLAV